jgi:hypothetical protein
MKATRAMRCSSACRCACVTSCVARNKLSNRCALRSAFAVSDATTWQKRTSLSEKGVASRSVRRKIAPITVPRHRIGTTTIERTLRRLSVSWTLFSIGSVDASGMKTVSPDSKARFSSG